MESKIILNKLTLKYIKFYSRYELLTECFEDFYIVDREYPVSLGRGRVWAPVDIKVQDLLGVGMRVRGNGK